MYMYKHIYICAYICMYTCAFCVCSVCMRDVHTLPPSSKASSAFTHHSTACVRQSQIQSLPGRGFQCVDDA